MAGALITSILQASSLIPSLSQTITNGLSLLGTLEAEVLPTFITSQVPPTGFPWGDSTIGNTNPYTNAPCTGVTRSYDLTISRSTIAPDGVAKSAFLINGAFPGPLLSANWGDTFQITVHNNITGPEEGTTLHWHGFLQKGTSFMDGVPAVSQCPIAPGKSYTYTFQADLFGTSWYHSHYSAQYADGAFGPMVVYGPSQLPYDIDIGPVMLSDYYHTNYWEILENRVEAAGLFPPPQSDNNLINGKMNYACDDSSNCTSNAGLAKFQFTSSKTHRLRLINPSSDTVQRFSIDEHTLTVIANDFVPVEPYNTTVVTLGVGQRTDILVTAKSDPTTSVWMRSNASVLCSHPNQPYALAPIYYQNADTTSVPKSAAFPYVETSCANDPLATTVPYMPYTPPSSPAFTQAINISVGINGTGFISWYINGESFRGNYDNPILLLAGTGNTSYPLDPQWSVYNFGTNSSIRLIVNNPIQNGIPVNHPFHLHGHNFWVLADGLGEWDGVITNPSNPQRRDTQLVQGGGYVVLEYMQDNPGVWPFHCHIVWHVSQGLYAQFMENPQGIQNLNFPAESAQTCRDWATFAGHDVVDQIDSGL